MKTTSKTNLIASIVIAGAFTAGLASGTASAQNQPYRGPFEFEFRYDAAELGSLDGAQTLLARLQSVVTAYCGNDPTMSPQERFDANKCVKRTMREAIAKFDNATVAQAFSNRADG
jgi:UrcA family protein